MPNYKLATEPHNTIALPINLVGLPATIEIEGNTLLCKDTFHVSLVSIKKILEKFDVHEENFVEKVNNDFSQFVTEHEIKFLGFKDEYLFVEEDDKKAVVCMCEISNINQFFDLLNKKYSLQVPYPPMHATIYTLQPNVGIFITDKDDLDQLTKKIQNPLGKDLNTFVCPV